MSTTSLTAGEVMDKSASLMNDTAKTIYTYTAQLPYLQMALDELQEEFELNNIPVTGITTPTVITVPIGTKVIGPIDGVGATAAPNYPTDLVEIQQLWERLSGSTDPFIPITKRGDYLPHEWDDIFTESLGVWAWENQQIRFVGALTARSVKIDYIAKLFPALIDSTTTIGIINAKSFLMYRTAGLCSRFIGENPSRADQLDTFAQFAMDRVTGIGAKGRQDQTTRRRPFMASYRSRTVV